MASDLKKPLEDWFFGSLGLGLLLLGLEEDTINTINRKKSLEKENEEERPIFQTLFIEECL